MRWVPFGAAVALSLVVLFTPASGVPVAPPGTDKVIHLLLFALLAATGRRAGLRAGPLLVGLLVYAAASEVAQALLPIGRTADAWDALVDTLGAVLGALAAGFLAGRRAAAAEPTAPADDG